MAELHPEMANEAARTALRFVEAESFRSAWWGSDEPWPHRSDLAHALEHAETLASMVLNLADRVSIPDKYDEVLLPFLTLMRRELHANTRKGDRPGWLAMDANTALLEVYWHVAKLSAAVKNNDGPAIMEHGADVANMAMMVLDVCGSLAWVDVRAPIAGPNASVEQVMDAVADMHIGSCGPIDNRTRPLTDQSQPWTPEHCKAYPRRASEEIEYLRAVVAAPAAPGAAVPAEPDMLAICAALGFDPTNHHNAAKCPYCSPVQPGERELPPLPRPLGIIRMTQMGLPADLAQCAQDIEMWAYGIEEVFTADQLHDYARAAISSVTKETKK